MKVGSVCYLSILVFSFQFFSHNNISGIVFVFVFVFVLMARSGAAASQLPPPPQLSAAISQQYGIHIDLNSYESVRRLCICFDPLFEPKCVLSTLKVGGKPSIEVLEIQKLQEVISSKKPLNVSIRSLLLMNAHSTLIPIELPCVQSQLSADLLSSAKAAIAARGAAGELPHRSRSSARADQDAAWASMTAPKAREVCLDLQVSRRFSRFNFVYVLRNLLRLNLTNDLSLENDYDYLANVRLDEDPDLEQLFSGLNRTIKMSSEKDEEMIKYKMVEVDRQGGTLTEELKNTIRGSILTFTPIWPESVRAEGDGAETFKHRIVVITDGENDHYEPTPEWGEEGRDEVMQKIAFGISFKAVIMIQISDTERICMEFVLNLNKKKLFELFSDLMPAKCGQCWFYLDDLISIILESREFKKKISDVFVGYTRTSLSSFIKSAYDNPISSFAVVDAGCNHPIGYLSPDPGPSAWTWNDVNFEITGEIEKQQEEQPEAHQARPMHALGGGVMVGLVNRTSGGSIYYCTFPESMRGAFNNTIFTDPMKVLHEGPYSLGSASQEAVEGSLPDSPVVLDMEEEAAAAPESRARRIVANIFKTIHTLLNRVVCGVGSGSGAAAALGRGGASKKNRKSIRTRRASRARRSRRSRRSRK
jgi:hypothetical protein